jgi:hypothetical protein
MKRFIPLLSGLILMMSAYSIVSEGGTGVDRAEELLKQARTALGGEANLRAIQSFSVSGKLRRVTQARDQSGEIKIDFLLPDKFKKTETMSLIAGVELTLVSALNGDHAWRDSRSSSSNAQVTVIGRDGGKGQQSVPPKEVRADFARNLLGLLLSPPASFPIRFYYAGVAEAPDGKADVIDARGPDGFEARLFLDKNTHRPLMLSYKGMVPRLSTMRTQSGRESVDKIVKDAQAGGNRQQSEIQIRYSDYRIVNGVMLPHRITKTADGKTSEEWEITKFKINPTELRPEKFVR